MALPPQLWPDFQGWDWSRGLLEVAAEVGADVVTEARVLLVPKVEATEPEGAERVLVLALLVALDAEVAEEATLVEAEEETLLVAVPVAVLTAWVRVDGDEGWSGVLAFVRS